MSAPVLVALGARIRALLRKRAGFDVLWLDPSMALAMDPAPEYPSRSPVIA